MPRNYPGQDDLVHRLRRACLEEVAKPIVFMLGSGVSRGAVPTTADMVKLFRGSIEADPDDLRDFNARIDGLDAAQQYQRGAQFLIDRAGLPHLNRVVRIAVLQARTPRLPVLEAQRYIRNEDRLRELEEDQRGWVLPSGLAALGRVLELIPAENRGPILTTNFDPLAEVSVKAAGLGALTVVSDDDGAVQIAEPPPGVVEVIHLHGHWRMGDTLHTAVQLESDRSKLLGSLRQVLTNSTCVVLGYGGWDDVLTSAMLRIVEEGSQRELEVLWACHGERPEMGVLTDKSLPGRIQPYVNVDANGLMIALDQTLTARLPQRRKTAASRRKRISVVGFTTIDETFNAIERARVVDEQSALSYFDGRDPSWVDILLGRAAELTALDLLKRHVASTSSRLCTLLEGPAGEGKSTLLRQLAAAFSEDPQYNVLWRDPGGADWQLDEILDAASTSVRWLLLVDDADIFARQISEALERVDKAGRADIRFVLAARDTDWRRRVQIDRILLRPSLFQTLDVAGLTLEDAAAIVERWSAFGPAGLGRLALQVNEADRARVLQQESMDAGQSALLGALLAVRYGGQYLQHIRELLARISRTQLPSGARLVDAYVLICLLPNLSLSPVTLQQLATAFNLSEHEVKALVVDRLGREAAASRHGEVVVARHRRIADATIQLAPEFGISLTDTLRSFVRAVVSENRGRRWTSEVVEVAFCGQQCSDERMALAAMEGAIEADPEQLRLRLAAINLQRRFGHIEKAARMSRETWGEIEGFSDESIALRRFLREWAVIEGLLQRSVDAAGLNASALLDIPGIDTNDRNNASRGLSALALCFDLKGPIDQLLWRGVIAEAAIDLADDSEVRQQAEQTLGRAVRDGYRTVLDQAARKRAIRNAIKYSLASSDIGPARRFKRHSQATETLFGLLD